MFGDPKPVKAANGDGAVVSDLVSVGVPNTGLWKENPELAPIWLLEAAADTEGAGT
jgi:hypothetical protein